MTTNESAVSAMDNEEDSSFLTHPDIYPSEHFKNAMNESDILEDNDMNDHSSNNRPATQPTLQTKLQHNATEMGMQKMHPQTNNE